MENVEIKELLDRLVLGQTLYVYEDKTDSAAFYIPYILNDAAEYYIRIENARTVGAFDERTAVKKYELLEDEKCIIFTHTNGNVFTLWYEKLDIVFNLYSFHRLGHFWKKGYEQWSRLNYVIGTIYDKFSYIGKKACNEFELEYMKLLGFVPFRMFSPIEEEFDIFYSDEELLSLEIPGIKLMKRLADEVSCHILSGYIDKYWQICEQIDLFTEKYKKQEKNVGIFGIIKARRINRRYMKIVSEIHEFMKTDKCFEVYSCLIEKLENGLCEYKNRSYDYDSEALYQHKRNCADKKIREEGFVGEYPLYTKDDCCVHLVEEHPYVVNELEYDGFGFNIYAMKSWCPKYKNRVDGGFFLDKEGKNFSEIVEM